jgi:serine/threonine protein kinase
MDTTRSGGEMPSAFSPGPGDLSGSTFGPYQVLRELARGGQGAVLEAVHVELGTPIALKILLDADPVSVGRFRQEAQVLARLSHPNLIRIHDMGVLGGVSFIAMELVRGTNLRTYIKERGVPDPAWSAAILATIGDVLHACHEVGIVHRDLKPHNILIEEGTDRPVLVDFGLLKRDPERFGGREIDGAGLSISGEVMGTPSYMSPEQADSSIGPISPRTDVYGLAATLYFALTGEPPFVGQANYNVFVKLLRDPPPNPRKANPRVSLGVARTCLKALAKEPKNRQETAAQFAAELRAQGTAADEPAGKRRAGTVGAVLAVVALVCAGVGVGGLATSGGSPATQALPPKPRPPETPPETPPAVPKAVLSLTLRKAEVRWVAEKLSTRNHINAVPVVADLDGDGVKDVLIHVSQRDREADLVALDGVRGGELWRFREGVNTYYSSIVQQGQEPVVFTGMKRTAKGTAPDSLLIRLRARDGEVLSRHTLFKEINRPAPRSGMPLDAAGRGTRGYAMLLLYDHDRKKKTRLKEPATVVFVDAQGQPAGAIGATHLGRGFTRDVGGGLVPVDTGEATRGALWAYLDGFYLLQQGAEGPHVSWRLRASGPLLSSEKTQPNSARHGRKFAASHAAVSSDHKRIVVAWSLADGRIELVLLAADGTKRWTTHVPGQLESGCLNFVEAGGRRLLSVATGVRDRHELTLLEEATGKAMRTPIQFGSVIYMTGFPFRRRGHELMLVATREPEWRTHLVDLESGRVMWASEIHRGRTFHLRSVIADLEGDGQDELVQSLGGLGHVRVVEPQLPPKLGK